MTMNKRLILPLLLLFVFTGCRQGMPVIDAQGTYVPGGQGTIPAPGLDTGVVVGRLFSSKMDAPLSDMGIYLGEYTYLTPGPEHLISVRQEGSPHTNTDANGYFAIVDIPPGSYPLLAWTPFTSYVVPDESGLQELVVEVIAGQVTDLGEIQIYWP
jgi:hypothetical protein